MIIIITSIPDSLALQPSKCLEKAGLPEWMTKGKTTLTQKNKNKNKKKTS